jgi:hypothetical protein
MAITAQSIIHRATGLLQDPTSIRWPVDELVRFLNDGQREVVMARPDAINVTATMTLAAGTRQDLDSGGLAIAPLKLLEITRNLAATSTKQAVRMTTRSWLDAQVPGWHSIASSVNILHYMFDQRDPKTFYVYPPATVLAQVEVNYSGYPTAITEPGEGSLYTAVTGALTVPDIHANALLDYVMYRAYSKDASYAGNAQRAASHYQAFAGALGLERTATQVVAPTSGDVAPAAN